MSKNPWDPEATQLREALRELGYILYRDTPLKWLVRKLGMKPKDWILEREQRDAQNKESKP